MNISFDVISDLNLELNDCFNWANKATSLYCIIAGNVSDDIAVIEQTLTHLSQFYSMVFYIPGSKEYNNVYKIKQTNSEIVKICRKLQNVVYLHNHVIIVDGVAVLAVSGWYEHYVNHEADGTENEIRLKHKASDLIYLENSIAKLQLHLDIKRILMVSSCVPGTQLFFGKPCPEIMEEYCLMDVLKSDLERKISTWVFGSFNDTVNVNIDGIQYVSNPYNRKPYWPQRIEVKL